MMSFEHTVKLQCLGIALTIGVSMIGCNPSSDIESSVRPSRPALSAPPGKSTPRFYTVDVYGEERDVEEDLKMTTARAASEKKRILLQVGGDWCGWCKRLTAFIESEAPVRSSLEKNYLLMKVTWTQKQPNEAFLSKYPKIVGYPHLFVLDADGNLLHSQDTSPLEEGSGYNQERVLAFLEDWKAKE